MGQKLFTFCAIVCVGLCQGSSIITQRTTSTCGDWTPYNDEKCLKIAERAGLQTQADGEVICKAYADSSNIELIPRLITIKTKEEQDFMQRFLFVEHEVLDSVWLGLVKSRNSQLFEWNDDSQLSFSNWANETISDTEHECVQMDSGESTLARGVWLKVNCKKRNVVVCERRPYWSLEALQNEFLNFKLEQERNVKELKQELAKTAKDHEEKQTELKEELAKTAQDHETKQQELKQELAKSADEISNLKANPVPLGFIYTQLPNQRLPTTLWPETQWIEITSSYSGLFFRVAGGEAAEFGQMQEGSVPRLKEVHSTNNVPYSGVLSIPLDGSLSGYITSGTWPSKEWIGLQFQYSTDEVRPRNQAIKIWQRIK